MLSFFNRLPARPQRMQAARNRAKSALTGMTPKQAPAIAAAARMSAPRRTRPAAVP